jgi:hypothetical protein
MAKNLQAWLLLLRRGRRGSEPSIDGYMRLKAAFAQDIGPSANHVRTHVSTCGRTSEPASSAHTPVGYQVSTARVAEKGRDVDARKKAAYS